MTTNAGYEYKNAELRFISASTNEEKLQALEEMIRTAPKHKSSENMLANLKSRYVKLKKELERAKAVKKGGHSLSIKKEGDGQVVVIGFANSGKSSLLTALTNAKPLISPIPYSTVKPEIGTLDLEGIKLQLIELPANLKDKEILGIAKTSDLILVLITSLKELSEITTLLKEERVSNKKIFILGRVDSIDKSELARLKPFGLLHVSAQKPAGLEELKQKILENTGLMRIYTKEPGKKPSEKPLVLKKDSPIKELAEKIRKDFVNRFIKARIWGASAKFSGQTVGLEHVLHDKDVVELYLK